VLFTEVNGRLGGCTHIHVIAERLLGPHYADTYTLLTRNKVHTGPFPALLDMLDRSGLLFTPERGRGVIIATEDTARTGTIEYIVMAPHAEAAGLEQRVLEVCAASRETTTIAYSQCQPVVVGNSLG
jgi:hypothetical protein